MFLNFSIKPLRLSAYLGLFTSCLSVLALICILIDKIWIEPGWPAGIPTLLASIVLFAGLELMILGLIGEYLGRLYLDQTGTPQYVVRYTIQVGSEGERSHRRPPDDKDRAERNVVPIQVAT